MLYYPQLLSGAVAQFPIERTATLRSIANDCVGGATIRMADAGFQKMQWRLKYASLTNSERASLEGLFEAAEGQLNTFTFLDPTDNLLEWSEDWTQSIWAADPLLHVAGGVSDPFGGTGAIQLTNTASTTQQIVQSVACPSSWRYCFTVYVRSGTPQTIQMMATTTGYSALTTITTGSTWTRAVAIVQFTVLQSGMAFGVQLPAGAQVQVFGAQVEAQPEAGLYKKTTGKGGVYTRAHFASDSLTFSADAPNQNSCQIDLVSTLN